MKSTFAGFLLIKSLYWLKRIKEFVGMFEVT